MRDFRRAILSLGSIILIVILVSVAVIYPYVNSETFYYQDKNLRAELSGDLDYLIIGSSHGLAAFKSTALDEELGCNSYNLSGGMMTFAARYYLLKKEIERNPIDTVVIEVSFNALTSENDDGYGEGDSSFLPRLESFSERVDYLAKYVEVDDWLNVYAKLFIQGLSSFKYRGTSEVDYAAKGYRAKETIDLSLNPNEVAANYNCSEIPIDFTESNVQYLQDMVDLCKSNNVRVIIAVTPLSNSILWRCRNFDDFRHWLNDFSDKNDCEFYDFNLLRNRYDIINDRTSFYDMLHMSDTGATVFTESYAEIIKRVNSGEDVSSYFYESYEQAKQYSPYMEYMQSNS